MKTIHLAAAAALAVMAQGTFEARAATSIETVTVGDINNPADTAGASDGTTGYGSVGYSYNIGKYEVTIGQYTEFLNAVAATDTYALYNTSMGTNLSIAGIARSGVTGNFTYSVMNNGGDSANRPITYVSWFDAARFSNWMANGQPVGAQGNATTENGAYTLNGTMSRNLTITKNTTNPNTGQAVNWWIPSENEWYKAAYYDPNKAGGAGYWLYPTQSDSAPGNVEGAASGANYFTGVFSVTQSSSYSSTQNYLTSGGAYNAASHYGTFDQGGNVWEWNDAVISDSFRSLRGGSWLHLYGLPSSYRYQNFPDIENNYMGFRVASVPEPSAAVLVLLSGAGWLVWKRRKIAV